MRWDRPLDEVIQEIHGMERGQCLYELTHFDAVPLDFQLDFLQSHSDEWLRHTLLAAVFTAHRRACRRPA